MRRALQLLLLIALCLPAVAQTKPDLWEILRRGNQAFVGGSIPYNFLQRDRDETAGGQQPAVAILSCADSRVPPELIFHQTIGDLFVVRAAGSIADDFGVASLEYSISKRWTKLIVVLGHEHCGAVEEALKVEDAPTPALRALVQRIRSSFVGIPYDPKSPYNLTRAIEANTRASAAALLADSALIRDAVAGRHDVQIVTAMYDLKSGKVRLLE